MASESSRTSQPVTDTSTLRSVTLQSISQSLRSNISADNQSLFDDNLAVIVCDYAVPDAQPLQLISVDPTNCDLEIGNPFYSLSDLAETLESMRTELKTEFDDLLESQSYIMNWAVADVALLLYCVHHSILLQALNLPDYLWKEWVTDNHELAMIHNALNEEQQQFFANKWNELAHFAFTTENQQQKVREWITNMSSAISHSFIPVQSNSPDITQSTIPKPTVVTMEMIQSFLTRIFNAQHVYRFISGKSVISPIACIEGAAMSFTEQFNYESTSASSTGNLSERLLSSTPVPILAVQRESRSGNVRIRAFTVNALAELIKNDDVRLYLGDSEDNGGSSDDDRPIIEVAYRVGRRVW